MLKKLSETRTQIEADLVISRLRAAGLHPSDLRTWPHITLAGADLFFPVEVPDEEVESGHELLYTAQRDGDNVRATRLPGLGAKVVVALVLALIASGMLLAK